LSDEWYSLDRVKWVFVSPNKRYNDLAWVNHITDIEVDALMKSGRIGCVSGFNGYYDEERSVWVKWVDGQRIDCEKPSYPTSEMVNNWQRNGGMGHDGINQWICVKTRANHLGVYGKCEYCEDGEIWHSEDIKAMSESWQPFEPPLGDGFQMWETTSEGSPKSPVFATIEELCEWLDVNKASVFGSNTASKEDWIRLLSDDLVAYQSGNSIFI
jgi:hypothetical protein